MSTKKRVVVFLVAVGLVAGSMAMAGADREFTSSWPEAARWAWAFAIGIGLMAGLSLVLVAVGIISRSYLAALGDDSTPVPTTVQFIAAYVGSLTFGAFLAVYLERVYGISGLRTIFCFCGLVCILAGFGWPWWLFAMIRRLDWFALIGSDRAMRWLLVLVGLGLLAAGFLAPSEQFV